MNDEMWDFIFLFTQFRTISVKQSSGQMCVRLSNIEHKCMQFEPL